VANPYDADIITACRAINLDIKKFNATKREKIISELHKNPTTFYKNIELFKLYLGCEVLIMDINACYFNLLRIAGIITKKTYDKFLPKKKARLIAVGNTYKKTYIIEYKNGEPLNDSKMILNPNEWVWKYVVSESWKIFREVNEATNNNVILFKTDCFTIDASYEDITRTIVEKHGLTLKKEYKILEKK
jgi:hypothetical protein